MNDSKPLSAVIVAILLVVTLVAAVVGGAAGTLAAATASASNDDNNNNINSRLGCFTTFLKKEEIGLLLNNLWGVATIADLPAQLDSGQQNPDVVLKILLNMPIEQPRLNGLIVCLQDTGIVFA
ncbi:MAG: hypothetical protein WA421_00915 [Nitrososphaeraceae archaeon]|jgi:hypothetical protein